MARSPPVSTSGLRWISSDYLVPSFVKNARKKFSSAVPFPFLVLPQFLVEEKYQQVRGALLKEEFIPKESDLFKFSQTNDFVSTKNSTLLKFRNILCSPSFILWMEKLSGMQLATSVVDMSGSLYEDTDFLLCHDDQLEGRAIAFLYYLSDLERDDGGGLQLLGSTKGVPSSVAATIIPRQNCFVFFRVSPTSFHIVEEVVKPLKRYTLGGWFHGRD